MHLMGFYKNTAFINNMIRPAQKSAPLAARNRNFIQISITSRVGCVF